MCVYSSNTHLHNTRVWSETETYCAVRLDNNRKGKTHANNNEILSTLFLLSITQDFLLLWCSRNILAVYQYIVTLPSGIWQNRWCTDDNDNTWSSVYSLVKKHNNELTVNLLLIVHNWYTATRWWVSLQFTVCKINLSCNRPFDHFIHCKNKKIKVKCFSLQMMYSLW